jgi:hypothetical protein
MSKALFEDNPLLVSPKIAVKFGLNEAIILQQIHYWLEVNREKNIHNIDGMTWTYNSYTEWEAQFPFMSRSTIKRAFHNLEKYHILIYRNYNRLAIDRTKWYSINYNVLKLALETEQFQPLGQNDPTIGSKWTNHVVKMNLPLPENSTKNYRPKTTDNTYCYRSTRTYADAFKSYFGYECRRIKNEPVFDLDLIGDIEQMFIEYFEEYGTDYKQMNLEQCSIEKIYKMHGKYTSGSGW